jgi:hypothetical protein
MAKTDSTHPWQQIEEQALHACREWHLWLVLRERELAPPAQRATARPPVVAGSDKTIKTPNRH